MIKPRSLGDLLRFGKLPKGSLSGLMSLLKNQVAKKKVKIAFENADSSSRVELIPSKINLVIKLKERERMYDTTMGFLGLVIMDLLDCCGYDEAMMIVVVVVVVIALIRYPRLVQFTCKTPASLKVRLIGFDLVRCYLCPSFIEGDTMEGVSIRMVNSHTGNHCGDDFTSPETI
nr:hypothetical protein [Tanacetum cinerariifolium]